MEAWTRTLYARNVVAFVASIHGPSRRHLTHGVFAESILRSLDAGSRGRLGVDSSSPLSLDDFQERVSLNALALTGRQQFARCYIPGTVSGSIPIFDPPARRPGEVRTFPAARPYRDGFRGSGTSGNETSDASTRGC